MTTKTKTIPYDGSIFLADPADQVDVLTDAFESGHAGVVALALRDIAKAQGMTEVAKKVGITRAGLYKALSGDGDPKLSTVVALLQALCITLHAKPGKTVTATKGVSHRQREFKHQRAAKPVRKAKSSSQAAATTAA